jgi:FKBP-type peptidyl-prolyl cis-trans isomerase
MVSSTRLRLLALAAVLALVSSACGSDSNSPSAPDQSNVAYSQTDLVVGTGASASSNSTITTNYALWLYSDTATDHKGTPIESHDNAQFVLSMTIAGWRQGIAGMKVGGQRRLIVPPSLAYGAGGSSNGAIPPNAALVFDIELVSIP